MNEKKLETYSVWVMRRDQAHITVMETGSFEEADKVWQDLNSRWTNSLKEQVPFILRAPLVTAFDPGLIYEIALLPYGNTNVASDNPYQQNMRQNGFSNTFNKVARTGDILDGGYRY